MGRKLMGGPSRSTRRGSAARVQEAVAAAEEGEAGVDMAGVEAAEEVMVEVAAAVVVMEAAVAATAIAETLPAHASNT
jgi:hypothetical protein